MNENTINNDVTIAGSDSVLAGRYRIIKQLGQGGMGSVWLAEDTQLDNKLFAIKMLPSVLVSNKRAYNQLKSEALVAMKLVHPNIVQIRAFEENNGNPFLVMDYIDGETLDDWLGDRSQGLGVSEEEVVKLLKPIAEALDYAHTEGVVHRDVKPANVMIRKDGRPFIMDFGIAREIQETMTRVTGKLSSGTLLYMSPEQLNGASPKPAQDVYSFAAMVYECLKGEPPFSRGQIEYQILNTPPPPLPEGIRLRTAVMRGLSKEAGGRQRFCREVLVSAPVIPAQESGGRISVYSKKRTGSDNRRMTRFFKRNFSGMTIPLVCAGAALLILCGAIWHRACLREQTEQRKIGLLKIAESIRRQEEEEEARKEIAEAKEKAKRLEEERKVREYRLARLKKEEQIRKEKAKEEELRQLRDREFKTLSASLLSQCVFAREEAVRAEAECFAKREFSVACAMLKQAEDMDVSSEKGRTVYLDKMREVKCAFENTCQTANRNARPVVRLTASLNGDMKEAKVTGGIADAGKTTPIDISTGSFPLGTKGSFTVEYSEDGVEYEGECEYTVKKGLQSINVELTPKYTLPANIRHCRHCGISLTQYSRNIKNCPSCGNNLFQ